MTKVLKFTDLHLHSWATYSDPDPEYGLTRVRYIVDSLYWIRDQVLKYKPDIVLFGGDMVEDRRRIDWATYNRGFKAFQAIAEASRSVGAEFFALLGNHDMFGMNQIDSATYPLSGVPGVRIIDTPQVINGIRFIPYTEHFDFTENVHVAFAHVSVVELMINGKYIGASPIDALGALITYSGHYHVRTRFSAKSGNVIQYVGSCLPRNFADEGEHHFGAVLIEFGESETLLSNPHVWKFRKIVIEEGHDCILPLQSFCRVFVAPEMRDSVSKLIAKENDPSKVKWKILDLPSNRKVRTNNSSIVDSTEFSDEKVLLHYLKKVEPSDHNALFDMGMKILDGTFKLED